MTKSHAACTIDNDDQGIRRLRSFISGAAARSAPTATEALAKNSALRKRIFFLCGSILLLLVIVSTPARSQVSITTERYDNSRSGADLNETILNSSNVNVTQFGLLYHYAMDGFIQAQPLYVPNVIIPGRGTHNVLYVVTMNDVIYAFDADSNAVNGGLLWSADFRNPAAGIMPIPITDIVGRNDLNIVGNVGIESTPVIDLSSGTLYLVARTKEVSGSVTNYVAKLHALDITNGSEKFTGPVTIRASVPGSGQGSSGGTLTFDPLIHNQRSSLALVNGLVVFSWAGHEDMFSWHGWVMAYDAHTLAQSSVFCSAPSGLNGGIWMAGRAPVVDANGNLYYATGNGNWDGTSSFGDSVIKLSTTGGTLALTDYFTPDDYATLQSQDLDLASSGPLLIPGTNLLLQGGKESIFYLMNLSSLGHEQSGNTQIVQSFATTGSQIFGGPVFWNRTTGAGPTMYVWPNNISLQAYQFRGSTFNTNPISQSTTVAPIGNSGGVLTLSANGSTAGTGIVWSSMPISQDGDHGTVAGVLRAYDANNLTSELWNSQINPTRDAMGLWPKYSPPTVVDGKVYMASFSNALNVYGLLASQDYVVSATPSTQSVGSGANVSYTVSTTSLSGFSGAISLSATGLPTGATASFNPSSVAAGASSTLTVTTSTSTPFGSFTLTITGTSGSLAHSATVTLNVTSAPDFTLSATPASQTVTSGGSTPYTVNTSAVNGFGGSISLSATGLPTGATASFNPSSVAAGASSTLTVATSTSTPFGSFTLTITGTSGSLAHSATVTLKVTSSASSSKVISIDFVGQDVPMSSAEVAGVVAKANWNNASGAKSSAPLALVDETGISTSDTVTWSSNNTWSTPITDQPGNARMMKGYLDTGNTTTTTVSVAGLSSSTIGYQVYVYADGDNGAGSHTASYQINGTGITTTIINLTDAANTNFNGTFTQASNSAGNYVVFTINSSDFTVSATPGASTDGFQRAPINGIQIVPTSPQPSDFTLSATPASQTVTSGGSTSYTVNTSAVSGFSGSISLSATGLPTGATASFNPSSVAAGTSSTLTVATSTSTPFGSFTLTITGTSGSLAQSATVTLNVTSAPDFTVSATPASETVTSGGSTPYTVNTSAVSGFSGAISLSATGLPTGATASFNPSSVAAGASSTLTVTTSTSTPLGSFTLTITGTSGSLAHSATVTLNVTSAPDFTLSATPASQTVTSGGSTPYTVNTSAVSGFGGSISLSATGLPTGATASFNPSSVAAGASSTLTVTTSTSTPLGSFTLTITGTSGSLAHSATVTLNVTSAPDFTLSATPASQTVTSGGSTPYTVNTSAVNGFSGSISLSATGLPTGATASFNPSSVAAGASSTLTVATSTSTPFGSFTLTITGTSGSLAHSATVTLKVTSSASSSKVISIDFVGQDVPMSSAEVAGVVAKANWNNASGAKSSAPLALVDETGISTSATVTWSSNNTWSTPITDQPGNARMMKGYLDTGNTTTTVSVAGLPSSAAGYQVYVYADGDNGAGSRTASYQISGTGITTTTINLTDAANTNFNGTFTQASNSAGNYVVFTINSSDFTVSATPGASTDGFQRAPINGIQIVPTGPQPSDFTLSATPASQTVTSGGSTSYTVNTSAVSGFSGSISLSATGLPTGATASFNPSSVAAGASSTLTVTTSTSTPLGSFTLTITGTSGSLAHSATVTLNVTSAPDFTLSATPASQTVTSGGSTPYTVNTSAVSGFSGAISLSATGLPTGATASFNPSSVAAGASSTLTVTTSTSTPLGSFTLTITGTSGSLAHSATVTLNVTSAPDFTLSATPASQTVTSGGSTPYTVNTSAVNGFSGSISLSATGLPTGATASFNPSSVAAGASSTLTVATSTSTPFGSFTLTITGTSGSLAHSATVTLKVTSSASSSKVISIDFVGQDVPMSSAEVAGVVAKANWNNASGAKSSAPLALVDETGISTSATVTWSSNNTWSTPITDQPGNARMMKGYLDTGNTTTTTVSVAGLPSSAAGYQVYVYADGDNGAGSHTASYQISGTGITTTTINLTDAANTNFNGTFTQASNSAGNYVVFTINSSDFTVSATPGASTDGFERAPINGIQIVPVSSQPSSKVISIDFVGQDVPMSSAEVAGVVAKANWNNASGAKSSAPLALVDETGISTSATVTWSSNNTWSTPITDQPGNARMMKGYLDTGNTTTTTVSVAGLPSSATGYQVYVYADGDNGAGSRTASYQISGTGITTTTINLTDAANTNFNGTFIQASNSAGNYVIFTIPASTSGFAVLATPGASTDAYLRAPIGGIQIVPN